MTSTSGPYSDHPNSRDDAVYWGLDHRQRMYFFGRLSAYNGREARRLGELAARSGRIAQRYLVTAAVLLTLSLVYQVARWWFA